MATLIQSDSPAATLAEHEHTYRRFMAALKIAIVLHAAGLPFLVLLFCTSTGFIGSALTGLVILALGVWWLRRDAALSRALGGTEGPA